MTGSAAFTASLVADRMRGRVEAPWEVFGERLVHTELHLNGFDVEMVRGPIHMEGYGVRVFRPVDGKMGVGLTTSTELGPDGIQAAIDRSEAGALHARFPTRRVELPGTATRPPSDVVTVDPALWDEPIPAIEAYVAALRAAFAPHRAASLSFGSIRVTRSEVTLANSEGLQRHAPRTEVEIELALKSAGGAEGAPPGEYWTADRSRGLTTERLADSVSEWCGHAEAVRHAEPVRTGPTSVVLSPGLLAEVLPNIIGFRFGATAALRKIAPALGDAVADPRISITDDGLYPGAVSTAPFDDEGVPQARRPVIERGAAASLSYDILQGSVLGAGVTGNGRREGRQIATWYRFTRAPAALPTTLVLDGPDGGSAKELCEIAGDGIWVDQLGAAFPDALSGRFGGELRVAYRIENGRLGPPVRGGTLGGIVIGGPGTPSMLNSLEAVGRSTELVDGLVSGPALVRGMSVAGA